MAKILKEFPEGIVERGRYPWDEWLDGQIRLLKQGVDFKCKATSFVCIAHVAAARRGGKLNTTRRGDGVVIQFVASNGKPA
jgi:hypothetical protein